MWSSTPRSKSFPVDVVFPKVFGYLLIRFREEKLGYEHSAPLGGPKHEVTPALEHSCHMLKNGSFKEIFNFGIDPRL